MKTADFGSSKREGLKSNIFTKRFFMVEMVIGEGIGQRRRSEPCLRNIHSGKEGRVA